MFNNENNSDVNLVRNSPPNLFQGLVIKESITSVKNHTNIDDNSEIVEDNYVKIDKIIEDNECKLVKVFEDSQSNIIANNIQIEVNAETEVENTNYYQLKNYQNENTILQKTKYQLLPKVEESISTTGSSSTSTLCGQVVKMSSMLGNSIVPSGLLPPLDHYRLQLYNYAMAERLRCSQYPGPLSLCPPNYPAAVAAVGGHYGSRFALSMSLFHNRVFQPEEPKPQHSYIGLIAMAILSSPETKLVLSDIYQHILDNYPYFRTRGPGWRNSIRHNLSLNDCFIKAGRSANGKGHYWAIHPANIEDFKKGDFRRRKAQRKVRKHMGLAVDDEGTDSQSPPPLAVTPPIHPPAVIGPPFCNSPWTASATIGSGGTNAAIEINPFSQSRKRQFDVASLLAPDGDNSIENFCHQQQQINRSHHQQHPPQHHHQQQQHQSHHLHQNAHNPHHSHQQHDQQQQHHQQHQDQHQHRDHHHQPEDQRQSQQQPNFSRASVAKRFALATSSDIEEDIDVVASDVEDNNSSNDNGSLPLDQQSRRIISQQQDEDDSDPHESHSNPLLYATQNIRSENIYSNRTLKTGGQGRDEDATTESPLSQHEEDTGSGRIPSPASVSSTRSTWRGLMQQWPTNFSPLGVSAMDPRILGRYYGQYMAAAAAQQAAASRRAVVVGTLLNGAAAAAAANNNLTNSGIEILDLQDHQINSLTQSTNDC